MPPIRVNFVAMPDQNAVTVLVLRRVKGGGGAAETRFQ
jgi:hypothetical protein